MLGAMLLIGCNGTGTPGGGGTASHATRTLGKADAAVKVVHFSAPW
jgi:hypothetical protein